MKRLSVLFFCFIASHLIAQNKMPVLRVNNKIKPDIEKVARDYYGHFNDIKGEEISETINTIEYKSKIIPPGATESTIQEIKGLQNVYSWQATMLQTEDFEKAAEKYKQIYNQLNGANLLMDDNKLWKFKGAYDAPDETRAFASSILQAEVTEKVLQRLKVEVALNYNMPEWTVKILVYEKEPDEDMRPTERAAQ